MVDWSSRLKSARGSSAWPSSVGTPTKTLGNLAFAAPALPPRKALRSYPRRRGFTWPDRSRREPFRLLGEVRMPQHVVDLDAEELRRTTRSCGIKAAVLRRASASLPKMPDRSSRKKISSTPSGTMPAIARSLSQPDTAHAFAGAPKRLLKAGWNEAPQMGFPRLMISLPLLVLCF
jgi:hypothetical protein